MYEYIYVFVYVCVYICVCAHTPPLKKFTKFKMESFVFFLSSVPLSRYNHCIFQCVFLGTFLYVHVQLYVNLSLQKYSKHTHYSELAFVHSWFCQPSFVSYTQTCLQSLLCATGVFFPQIGCDMSFSDMQHMLLAYQNICMDWTERINISYWTMRNPEYFNKPLFLMQ